MARFFGSGRSRFNGVRQGPKSREASRERKARPGDSENLPRNAALRKEILKIFSRNSRSASEPTSPAIIQLAEEPKDFEVKPNQGDHKAKGPIPFHRLRQTGLRASLDEIEVDQQVKRGQTHDKDTETDADRPRVMDKRDVVTKNARKHRHNVNQGDRTRRRDDHRGQLLGDADDPSRVEEQHHERRRSGEGDRLDGDPAAGRVTGVDLLRDRAEEDPFQDRVNRRGPPGQSRLEDRQKGEQSATDRRAKQKAHPEVAVE